MQNPIPTDDGTALRDDAERLLKDITEGEWFLTVQRSDHDCYAEEARIGARCAKYHEHFIGRVYEKANAEFIAAAPRLVRSLLARLEAVEAAQGNQFPDDHTLSDRATIDRWRIRAQAAEAKRDELRKLAGNTVPCPVCQWPLPGMPDYEICACCGYEHLTDDPEQWLAQWNGSWWSQAAERKPVILRAAEAKLAQVEQDYARVRRVGEAVQLAREKAEAELARVQGYAQLISELADVYTVDTDQAALIGLVQQAKEAVRGPHGSHRG